MKMIEKKRKSRDGKKHDRPQKFTKKSKFSKKYGKSEDEKRRTGPRLPQSLRKELDRINPNDQSCSEEDEGINGDVYEYEEGLPEEESKKNRRFDSVENYEYKLPEDFKDENVESDDDDYDFDGGENKIADHKGKKGDLDQLGDDVEDEDDERHLRMLQGITGMPTQAFQGQKKNKVVVSEGYPESEYNPTRDVLDGDGRIAIEDLLESIQGKPGYRELRNITRHVEKKGKLLQAPLPKEDRDRLERNAAYEQSKKDITRWEPLVKRNREAPTIIFDKDTDSGFSTVGAIASEFEPRTEFEKKMSSLVNDDKVMAAHKEDGSRLLELNKISLEDYVNSRNHIAKMRSLLFRHEVKMKRVKKIKSKTYHRLLKKERLKGSVGMPMDAEEAKELAMKQEFKRAEERMTLRHKNQSKWAQRIVKRGLDAQDEGTRAAMAEQLHQHALLTRKMNSMKDSSSSDDSSDEEDSENAGGSDEDKAPKLLAQAREKTRRVLEEDDEVPDSGVLSLPFMKRALKKKKEAADEEGRLAIQEFESSLIQLEDADGAKITKTGTVSGRRVFGASKMQVIEPKNKIRSSSYSSDSEAEEDIDVGLGRTDDMQNNINVNSVLLDVDANTPQDSVLKISELVKDLGPKTTYEVSMLHSDTWKKMSSSRNEVDTNGKRSQKVVEPVTHNQDIELEEAGELKLRVLHIYSRRLDERKRRKDFILERNLLHPSPFEKDLTPEERALCRRFDPFMRFHSKEEHEELLRAVVKEHRMLKRVEELKDAQVAGCRTAVEADRYLEHKRKIEAEETSRRLKDNAQIGPSSQGAPNAFMSPDSVGKDSSTRPAGQGSSSYANDLDIMGFYETQLLSETEKRLCCEIHLPPPVYLKMQEVMTKEIFSGNITKKSDAHPLFKIEASKVDGVYDMLVKKGIAQP